MSRVLNIDRNQLCPICRNDGWVELDGVMTSLGVEYELGLTGCKWCEMGERALRIQRHGSVGQHPPMSGYEMRQVVPPLDPSGPPLSFPEYAARSADDPNIAHAIEMLSNREDKAALYTAAYRCRRDEWGPADADLWIASSVGEKAAEWVREHA